MTRPPRDERTVKQAALETGDGSGAEPDDDLLRAMASESEVLRHRDIADMPPSERARLAAMFETLAPRPPRRTAQRRTPWHRGDVDARRTLRQMLRQTDAVPEMWRSILGYYGRGEVARVLAALVAWRAAPEDLQHWEPSRVAVLAVRNRAWVEPLERTFEAPGHHFVAFGGGHLLGDEGVVALLRARGWEVTACVRDRCG